MCKFMEMLSTLSFYLDVNCLKLVPNGLNLNLQMIYRKFSSELDTFLLVFIYDPGISKSSIESLKSLK